jgi:hypothetical protein
LAILLGFVPANAIGQAHGPFEVAGLRLPDLVTPDNLDEVYQALHRGACKTVDCRALKIAIAEVLDNPQRRKNPGTVWKAPAPISDVAIKARYIDRRLEYSRAIWPDPAAWWSRSARDDDLRGWARDDSGIATAASTRRATSTRPGSAPLALGRHCL